MRQNQALLATVTSLEYMFCSLHHFINDKNSADFERKYFGKCPFKDPFPIRNRLFVKWFFWPGAKRNITIKQFIPT